jgi:hypothetical protein
VENVWIFQEEWGVSRERIAISYKKIWLPVSVSLLVGLGMLRNHELTLKNDLLYAPGSYGSYDHLLLDDRDFALFAILLGIYIIIFGRLYDKRMGIPYTVSAFFLASLATICVLDMTIGGWGIPGRCGSGLSTGNCFMVEGLTVLAYYYFVPAAALLSICILLYGKSRIPPRKIGKR